MSEQETRKIRDGILRGLKISYTKLLCDKKKSNSEIAYVENDKVVKVKAVEL